MGEAYRLPHPSFNRSIEIECRDDRLTSDAGVLILREVAERTGIIDWLVAHLDDPRQADAVEWQQSQLLLTRLLMLAQGWGDQDDVEDLQEDPVLRLATSPRRGDAPVREESLMSQPTLSRFSASLTPAAQRGRLNEALVVLAGRVRRGLGLEPEPVDLDVDSLPLEVHGKQSGSAYNGHYRYRMYHPLVASLGEEGDIVGVWLRPGNAHTADGAEACILGALARVEREIGPVSLVRLDAGFPSEHLLAALEDCGVDYVARIRKNQVLDRLADEARLPQLPAPEGAARVRFKELTYAANAWSRARRIVYVHIQEPGELFGRDFFLITSIPARVLAAPELLERYRKRGCAEDAMGQWKELVQPALSSTNRPKALLRGREPATRSQPVDPFAMNEVELLLGALAAGLVRAVERIQAMATGNRRRLRTVREQLLKVGARVNLTGRHVVVAIAASAREGWQLMWEWLDRLRPATAVGPAG